MTTYYVKSGGDGSAPTADPDVSGWGGAYGSIHAAFTAVSPPNGHTFKVSDASAVYHSSDISIPGNVDNDNPAIIICVSDADKDVIGSSRAIESACDSENSGSYDIGFVGTVFCQGIDFRSKTNVGINSGDNNFCVFENCEIRQYHSGAYIYLASSYGGSSLLIDCIINMVNGSNLSAGTIISKAGYVEMRGGSIIAGASVDCLFGLEAAYSSVCLLNNVDLSSLTIDNELLNPDSGAGDYQRFDMLRCNLPASLTFISDDMNSRQHSVNIESCDSGNVQEFFFYASLGGYVTYASNCYRPASGITWAVKMVSNADAIEFITPIRYKLSSFYSTANPTIRIETLTDGVTLQNDEFWIEIDYPDETDEAYGKTITTKPSTILTSPSNNTGSTDWGEEGALSTPTDQYVEASITDGAAGIHTVWACLAKPSSTVYVDPQVTVS